MTSEVKLKTGGDPRSLPDYAALRDEISKLTHPARPDVDWRYVETLCLRLYEYNGVELQTASWYTIARMHTTGLSGLNEGLALIVALTRHHWSVMWPLNTHARLEIITGLFNRLQKTLRAMPPDDRDNLPQLYQTETFLKALSDILARQEGLAVDMEENYFHFVLLSALLNHGVALLRMKNDRILTRENKQRLDGYTRRLLYASLRPD